MKNPHVGSDFEEFLDEVGLLEEVNASAVKRVIAMEIAEAMEQKGISKTEMAKAMKTSRSALDRLLDPERRSVTLLTLERAARALGKKLTVEFRA